MPSLKGHIKLSLKRTGKEFRELNEWMDGKNVPYRERINRHKLSNIPKYKPIVESLFGKEGVQEYLNHLKDDYNSHWILKLIKLIRGYRI